MFLEQKKLVIFDLADTLYYQRPVQKMRTKALIKYYWKRPLRWKELLALRQYEKLFEELRGLNKLYSNLRENHIKYAAKKSGISYELMNQLVQKWIFDFEKQHAPKFKVPHINLFFQTLKKFGYQIAIISDQPFFSIVNDLGLEADLMVDTAGELIGAYKPNVAGLHYILKTLDHIPKDAVFFSHDTENDKYCASNIGIDYEHVQLSNPEYYRIKSRHVLHPPY